MTNLWGLHDMHNSLFGDLSLGTHIIGKEGMSIGSLLNQLTTFIHEQNQQIQTLINEIRKMLSRSTVSCDILVTT